MKENPELQLVGHDGNIFAIMGSASRLLYRAGRSDDSKEMIEQVTSCKSYEDALIAVSKYVNTELSPDNGMCLESEDIIVDRELIPDAKGVNAYLETWFDVNRRFGIALEGDDTADLYATYNPDTSTLTATLVVDRCASSKHEYVDVHLYPSEKKMIVGKMDDICKRENDKGLKEYFKEWTQETGENQKKPKNKEKQHNER